MLSFWLPFRALSSPGSVTIRCAIKKWGEYAKPFALMMAAALIIGEQRVGVVISGSVATNIGFIALTGKPVFGYAGKIT